MSATIQGFFHNEAELGDEEDDESFDEETGEPTAKTKALNGNMVDSSEEDDDDDDEEAAAAVREGFIVDEDEEPEERARKRRERKKRRRAERDEEDENLDDDDMDLIGESKPDHERTTPSQPKLKRLKRGHKEHQDHNIVEDVKDIFASDDENDNERIEYEDQRAPSRPDGRNMRDEFEGFIEEDEFDDDQRDQLQEDLEVARPASKRYGGVAPDVATGLDESSLEDMRKAFGEGNEYDWALALEEQAEDQELYPEQQLELKDVFEPSQLAERLLTDEDNLIRHTDEPERFQIGRKPYKHIVLLEEQSKEEALWISNQMWPTKRLDPDSREAFDKSVAKVLEFMVTDECEVPFIFQHRKDYLIHATRTPQQFDPSNPSAPKFNVTAEKLLNQSDLWDIFEHDLRFRALVDKRSALERTYENIKSTGDIQDTVFEEMLPAAETMEEVQDIQDYLHFTFSSQLKDFAITNPATNGHTRQRPGSQRTMFERIRNGRVYNLVRAFGISADAFAQNALKKGRQQYTEDASVRPDDMADTDLLLDPPDFPTGELVLKAAKAMFAEEIAMSPKMRKVMRSAYYATGVFECFRTEKGLRKIDERHPYYEFKYLRNQQFTDIARHPELYLRMLKAEDEGLVEVKIRLQNRDQFLNRLRQDLYSDNYSEVADAWNAARREALDIALAKLDKLMVRSVKENTKSFCEDKVAKTCREEFSNKLDQAPYKPKGMVLGTVPRVLALSIGAGTLNSPNAICWAWVEEDGRVLENGKFSDLRTFEPDRNIGDGQDVAAFIELVERRKPDVIGVSGFSVETRTLYEQIKEIVQRDDLRGADYEDEDGKDRSDKLEVVIVNDEVARLYQTSERANVDHPGFAPLTKYCVALAKYLQNPMKEYAACGKDIVSISFTPSQQLVPAEKMLKHLETAMVDMVNLCGVDINDAVGDPYTANLLQYVCGLGPRKASQLLKTINLNGGMVSTRDELVGDPDEGKLPAVGPRVWSNCASFLFIEFDTAEASSDYLDNTRVHPEDYELGRKMAADALELDEEDIAAEVEENGPGAIIRKLIKDDAQEKVNDLVLEEYAEQLETRFNQRKRATLETIRAELQVPYEELRRNFALLSTNETFIMLTGETPESLIVGMTVPVSLKRINDHEINAKLDCGIDGLVPDGEITDRADVPMDVSVRQIFSLHQTVQAKILDLDRRMLKATLTLRESSLRRPWRPNNERMLEEWDEKQEEEDRESLQVKNNITGRTQRVIKHPLFRPFNSTQAEEFLGSQGRGDVVIRPSSKGSDHLAVTWKVSDNVYQHIDVLELDKENEFSVGKTLKIAGKYTYSDLDELIVNHVKAMARKVDEMMGHEKYRDLTLKDTERWLTTYTEANPKRSVYNFCLNDKYPGYFYLVFKAGQHAHVGNWPVKVVPNAFECQRHPYPDMRSLCNGFKLLFQNMQNGKRR
ncbi:MAG: Transcription elongation factor spt6 [Candelaria pacifica]|nr:MAG: Transcription elongation factor spt6 [Candelaria pacifica]